MAAEERDEQAEFGVEGFGSPVADGVHALLAPVVSTLGVDLVDVQWAGGTLRLAVETSDGDDGVTTDVLAEINRLVSPLLDQHDPVPGRYTLEVSSPGVERPLRRIEHFTRAVGEVVIVKTVPGHDPRRMRGRLRSVDDGQLTIDVVEIDGVDLPEHTTERVALVDIASARTHFDWGPTPKKGGKNPNKGQKKTPAEHHGKGKAAKQKHKRANTTEEERGRT